MKNKYLLWLGSGAVTLLLVVGGVLLWHLHATADDTPDYAVENSQAAYRSGSAEAASGANQQDAAQNQTIAGNTTTTQNNPQLSAQTSTQTPAATTTTNPNVANLLNPTTFAQYDMYKNETSARYIDLQVGTGATLAAGQKAAVYYRGWLTNGKLFDQSQAGADGVLQAFGLTLGAHQVITGWEQGLEGMKVGGVRLLIIPPSVGYGATGQGPIPGNSVLVFQVQLAAVQ